MRSIALFAAAALLGSTAAIAQSVDDKGASPASGESAPTYGDSVDVRTPGLGVATAASAIALTEQDHLFIDRAVQVNLAEIAMAEMVKEKEGLPVGVVTYADQIIKDHTKAQEQVTDIAQTYSIEVPDAPMDAHQRKADMLESMSGDEFVNAYITAQIEAHTQAIALFEPEAAEAERGDEGVLTPLEEYAQAQLPVLRRHLEMAQNLQAELNPTASAQ